MISQKRGKHFPPFTILPLIKLWYVYLLSFLFTLVSVVPLHAMTLERPIIDPLTKNQWTVWSQFDSFDPRMDILGYTKKINPKAAKLNYVDTYRFGGIIAFNTQNQLSYTTHYQTQHVTRSSEPRFTKNNTFSHHVRYQWQFYKKKTASQSVITALETGFIFRKADTTNFYLYDLGATRVSWPGHVLFSLDANDMTYLAAIRTRYTRDKWKLHTGLELRYVRVTSLLQSQNPTVHSLLKSQAPQDTPWHEVHSIIQFSVEYDINQHWKIAADWQHYQINRIQYNPRKNKKDYNDNDTIDLYLSWTLHKTIMPYIHTHISRRFMLGTMPLTYNQRSNQKFKNPFGYLSIGLKYIF